MPESQWVNLFIEEIHGLRKDITDLRNELANFKIQVAADQGERRGRNGVIAGFISLVVSMAVAAAHSYFSK